MKKIYLIGGGGHCFSCIDVIESLNEYKISGIFDLQEKVGTAILGYPVIGTDLDLPRFVDDESFFLITMGQIKNPHVRIKIFNTLKDLNAQLATVVSSRAYISKHAVIGAGTIVMHDALVNANAVIGLNCIINSKALVEHGAKIEAHCHISTGAIVNGDCRIGEGSFIGSNSVLKEGVIISNNSVLKAGQFHR